ncbi:hypothetical protein ACIP79_27825 [Streptomyces sp. NPDC088747]|uniref:hypothetical protein n=1 Tax=Streptomyces sp. NPDC088747 TaxID=3365886 RepID=UPI0037F7FC2E
MTDDNTDRQRREGRTGPRFGRSAALLGAVALVAAGTVAVTVGPAARAADTPKTALGQDGQRLTVSASAGLDPDGETLRVTGSGYDETKGVYVALCVDNGEGQLPTPCIGGVDMTGTSHSSAWISSNPPDYGEDLAIPYEEDGGFEVELTVDAMDEFTDCFEVTCVLATRADHTLSGDRSQDVKVPVAFVGQAPVDTDGTDDGGSGGTDGGGTDGGGTEGGTDTRGTDGGTTDGGTEGSTSSGTSGSSTSGTTTGGSLASTGVTVLGTAALAALLTAAGWLVHRRARAGRADTP